MPPTDINTPEGRAALLAAHDRATNHSQGVISPDITVCLEALPAALAKIGELERSIGSAELRAKEWAEIAIGMLTELRMDYAPGAISDTDGRKAICALQAKATALWALERIVLESPYACVQIDAMSNGDKPWWQITVLDSENAIYEAETLREAIDAVRARANESGAAK